MTWILIAVGILLQLNELQTVFNSSISCHNKFINDDLQSLGKQYFKGKSIFFIESSCKGGINSRQACSIESAAKANPKWQINVLFAGPVPPQSQNRTPMSVLKRYKNISFFRIHVDKYARGTPLRRMFASGILNASQWRVHHAADVLRIITLYKWGGVYVDLDVIIVKSFDDLAKNWVAKQDSSVAAGFVAFSEDKIGRLFAKVAIRKLEKLFDNDDFLSIGPYLIKQVLKTMCGTRVLRTTSCRGVTIYNYSYFYPVYYSNWRYYFSSSLYNLKPGIEYGHHMWNYMSYDTIIEKGSPYERLARTCCPKTFDVYMQTGWMA